MAREPSAVRAYLAADTISDGPARDALFRAVAIAQRGETVWITTGGAPTAAIVSVRQAEAEPLAVDAWERSHLCDAMMLLLHQMREIPENDLSEMPRLQALLERLMGPRAVPPVALGEEIGD